MVKVCKCLVILSASCSQQVGPINGRTFTVDGIAQTCGLSVTRDCVSLTFIQILLLLM